MTLRGERVAQGFVTVLADMHDEISAHTQTLLKILDRLDDGSAPASA